MKIITSLALIVLFTVSSMAEVKFTTPIRVYVFATEDKPRADGFTDPGQNDRLKLRMDSVKDLKKYEFDDKKKYLLVEDPADADLTIEVLERGGRPKQGVSYTTERLGIVGAIEGGVETRQATEGFLRIRLRVGDYSKDIENALEPRPFMWSILAGNTAATVKEWIQQNYTTLLSHRGTTGRRD